MFVFGFGLIRLNDASWHRHRRKIRGLDTVLLAGALETNIKVSSLHLLNLINPLSVRKLPFAQINWLGLPLSAR